MSDDDNDDGVLFRDDNDDGDDLPSYHSSPSNTEQLVYEELQPASSYQAPSEGSRRANVDRARTLGCLRRHDRTIHHHRCQPSGTGDLCWVCEINHTSQVHHMDGCLADSYDTTTKHLQSPDLLDRGLVSHLRQVKTYTHYYVLCICISDNIIYIYNIIYI